MSKYDVIVAGGGLGGCLVSMALKKNHPDWQIAVLEKESFYGGRSRSGLNPWVSSCGLNQVSSKLVNLFKQQLVDRLDSLKLDSVFESSLKNIESVGVCASGSLDKISYGELFQDRGVKLIGGSSALRDWSKRKDELFDKYKKVGLNSNLLFSKVFSGSLKDPSGAVLDIYAHSLGIPYLGSSFFSCFMQRLENATSDLVFVGRWSDILASFIESYDDIDFMPDTMIVSACIDESEGKSWKLKTKKGEFYSSKLVVAQSPWEALNWLDQNYFPAELLSIALKAKPVSVVSLTHSIETSDDSNLDIVEQLSDMILVPSEQVSVINTLGKTLSYQTPLDYEMFFEAPAVSKAVRRLKRARKKLMSLYPDIKTGDDFISLIPAGWTQIICQQARQIPPSASYTSDILGFCGDSYGDSFCPDDNIISSVENICSSFE